MFTPVEEWIRQVIDQLAVGQDVYLAPDSAPILPAREIHLETAFISEIPAAGNTIHIKKADGEVQIVDVDARSTAYLYLGTVDIDGKIQSWVFLSEEKFWDWWEWTILTNELNPYIAFREGITHFERGNGLISTNNNNVTVEFKASELEKELITTDRRELQQLLEKKKRQNAVPSS